MTDRKYCIATCHRGTEMGIFLAGPDDKRLTLEEAQRLAEPVGLLTSDVCGKGRLLFDCTPEEYWKEEEGYWN